MRGVLPDHLNLPEKSTHCQEIRVLGNSKQKRGRMGFESPLLDDGRSAVRVQCVGFMVDLCNHPPPTTHRTSVP